MLHIEIQYYYIIYYMIFERNDVVKFIVMH